MKRRDFLKYAGVSGLAMSVGACDKVELPLSDKEKNRKPNIIYILADDLGYGDLGCYGQDKIKTPNIDRMAAEGMKFTDHYSGNAVCAPARCSLMTGMHPGHATIRENSQLPLRPNDVTVAQLLKKAGYATGVVGKWGLGEEGSISVPNKVGFDYFYGYLNQGVAHFYYTPWIWENDKKIMIEENANGKRGVYTHDLLTKEALSFISKSKDQPFFLYLAYAIPHAEMAVPEDSLAEYKGKFPEKPKTKNEGGGGGYGTGLPRYGAQEYPNACYAAMISRMDGDVGRIFGLLKELGLDEDTLVIFTSDNGPSGEGGNSASFFDSNGPLRRQKASLYEGGIRVPMIARWPGKIKENTTSSFVSAFWDILPTCTDMAGVGIPPKTDGVSLVPTFLGDEVQKHEFLYWELGRVKAQAVRMGDWKGLNFFVEGRFELYNLKEDIGEKNNIADKHPDIVKKIKAIMKKEHVPSQYFRLPIDPKSKR
ncbi:MAG: sulfatase-like hydrolase/transferase [Planctomycetes bacterium]|nr:sulfatase-like hydrolase/transferase [Planctomycetota bacterium]